MLGILANSATPKLSLEEPLAALFRMRGLRLGSAWILLMGLLDSEIGKRRLLSIELPVIERYNDGRDGLFKIQVLRVGCSLVLKYRLKPGHNVYQLETRLLSSYPTVPPESRVVTPLKHCPHLLEGQTLCLWRQGSTRMTSRWDPAKFTCIFAVQAAWRWLACYEIWYETGEWPLPEAK